MKCGLYHTIGRTIEGKLYCWEDNLYGQLGNGSSDYNAEKNALQNYIRLSVNGPLEDISIPTFNQNLCNENIIDICCGFFHTTALTNNGEIFC